MQEYPVCRAGVEKGISGGYSMAMICPVFVRRRTLALIMLSLSAALLCAKGASTNLSFADGHISCEIISPRDPVPALVLKVLPMAFSAALDHVGPPSEPARLTLRLLDPPPFYKRVKALFRVEAFATQQGDEIQLHPGSDPLKLAFRIGHELSHWLAYTRHPVRPPLWLDEGLASLVGAAAAETCARTLKQSLQRPPPPELADNLFSLDELIALKAYPQTEDRSAAFYWQAEALVQAIRKRLGAAEFSVYLDLLSSPDAPDWQAPLRERWYFSDWDFGWLARQIQPDEQDLHIQ